MRLRLSLKHKLILIICLLLLTPYWALDYVNRLDNFLKQNLEQNLLLASQSLATGLHNRDDFNWDLPVETAPSPLAKSPEFNSPNEPWMVLPIRDPQLDGYDHEWGEYGNHGYDFVGDSPDFSLRVLAGKSRGYVQLLLKVRDPSKNNYGLVDDIDRFDNVIIKVSNEDQVRYYIVMSSGVGITTVKPLDGLGNILETQVSFIGAAWLETEEGYQLELRISADIKQIGFIVTDAISGEKTRRIRTSDTGINRLRTPSDATLDFFDRLQELGGRRVWLVDAKGGVIVKRGSLIYRTDVAVYNPFLGWFANTEISENLDPRSDKTRLKSPEVKAALQGKMTSHWFTDGEHPLSLVSAAHPIYRGDEVVGAIVIDESSTRILEAQRSTFLNLINIVGIFFLLVMFTLIYFAGRVTYRLSQLRQFTDSVSEGDGQITSKKLATAGSDEIGDLTRSFAAMTAQVHTYQDYLRKLASRLSHEIRTPLAVVRSSLENLGMQALTSDQRVVIERAEQGIERLTKILTRMREASAVEDSIQKASTERIETKNFFEGLVLGYQSVYPQANIKLAFDEAIPVQIEVAADLLAQALDKLIANAIDFSVDNQIAVRVEKHAGLRIAVMNRGPIIPKETQETIFDSMVSLRITTNGNARKGGEREAEPHLGLGLYVVRLVADYHQGQISVINLPEHDGVEFNLHLPHAC